MDRFTIDELERRVDEVLFYRWDPIGVNHYPSARAEYRTYVSTILEKLEVGDKQSLIDLLHKIQTSSIGMEPNTELANSVATLLFEHKEAIDNGHA